MSKVVFIPKDEIPEDPQDEVVVKEYRDEAPYTDAGELHRRLNGISEMGDGVSRIAIPRDPSLRRKFVANAFHDAFEMMGGVTRLAHWGDQNPSAFYKLWSRLLPKESSQEINYSGEVTIRHAVPPTQLDEPND